MKRGVSGIDGMPLLHCAHCLGAYGYWQVFSPFKEVDDVCLKCGEPFIMIEEINGV